MSNYFCSNGNLLNVSSDSCSFIRLRIVVAFFRFANHCILCVESSSSHSLYFFTSAVAFSVMRLRSSDGRGAMVSKNNNMSGRGVVTAASSARLSRVWCGGLCTNALCDMSRAACIGPFMSARKNTVFKRVLVVVA